MFVHSFPCNLVRPRRECVMTIVVLLVLVLKVILSLPVEWKDALKTDSKLNIRGLT